MLGPLIFAKVIPHRAAGRRLVRSASHCSHYSYPHTYCKFKLCFLRGVMPASRQEPLQLLICTNFDNGLCLLFRSAHLPTPRSPLHRNSCTLPTPRNHRGTSHSRTIMVLTLGPTCVMVPSVSLRRPSMNGGSTSGVKTEGDSSQGISFPAAEVTPGED